MLLGFSPSHKILHMGQLRFLWNWRALIQMRRQIPQLDARKLHLLMSHPWCSESALQLRRRRVFCQRWTPHHTPFWIGKSLKLNPTYVLLVLESWNSQELVKRFAYPNPTIIRQFSLRMLLKVSAQHFASTCKLTTEPTVGQGLLIK